MLEHSGGHSKMCGALSESERHTLASLVKMKRQSWLDACCNLAANELCPTTSHQVTGRICRALASISNQRSRPCAASIQLPRYTGGASPVAFADISAYRDGRQAGQHQPVALCHSALHPAHGSGL